MRDKRKEWAARRNARRLVRRTRRRALAKDRRRSIAASQGQSLQAAHPAFVEAAEREREIGTDPTFMHRHARLRSHSVDDYESKRLARVKRLRDARHAEQKKAPIHVAPGVQIIQAPGPGDGEGARLAGEG